MLVPVSHSYKYVAYGAVDRSWGSSVSLLTGVWFLAGTGTLFSLSPCPDQLWWPLSLLSSDYKGLYPQR